MSLSVPFNEPFSESSSAVASDVPGSFTVALGGRPYKLLTDSEAPAIRHESIDILRRQADSGAVSGAQSINPEGFWRVPIETWHYGAGQEYLDRGDADPRRFNTSKGVDVWTEWQLSLLPATEEAVAVTGSNNYMAVANGRVCVVDGQTVKYTQSPTGAWSTLGSTPAATCNAIATDGDTLYMAFEDDIYQARPGTTAASTLLTGAGSNFTMLGFAKGRLIAGIGRVLYNPIGGTLGTATLTHPSTQFSWVDVAEGNSHIYIAGQLGNQAYIYKTATKADGTALEVPSVAATLQDETVRSIFGYAGQVIIGTDEGFRVCQQIEGTGDLIVGALVETGSPVRDMTAAQRFVWFGWENYDSASTGIGRMDLSRFTDIAGRAPAYASDLMADGSANVVGVVTYNGQRLFSVAGDAVYVENDDKVASGTITSGIFNYRLNEPKVVTKIRVGHKTTDGSHSVALSVDRSTYTTVGSHTVETDPFAVEERGTEHQVQLTVSRGTDTGISPTITGLTIEAYPAVPGARRITAVLDLRGDVQGEGMQQRAQNVNFERVFIDGLRQSGLPTTWQEGVVAYDVVVENTRFDLEEFVDGQFVGVATVIMKEV